MILIGLCEYMLFLKVLHVLVQNFLEAPEKKKSSHMIRNVLKRNFQFMSFFLCDV